MLLVNEIPGASGIGAELSDKISSHLSVFSKEKVLEGGLMKTILFEGESPQTNV